MSVPVLLASGAWSEDLGNRITLEWSGCPACLDPIPCSTWGAAGTRTCQPYPCRCEDEDPDPPAWKRERAARAGTTTVYVCDPYISKKGKDAGLWVNRCPCWGQDPAGKPEGCCAHSGHNPRLRVVLDGVVIGRAALDQISTIPPDREAGWRAPHERVEDARRVEDVDPTTAYAEALGMPADDEPVGPYQRRWTHAELHCDCATPWDHLVTKAGKAVARVGLHCSDCHRHFRNLGAMVMHRRWVTDPCRDPATVRDPERGNPVLRHRAEGTFVIWG